MIQHPVTGIGVHRGESVTDLDEGLPVRSQCPDQVPHIRHGLFRVGVVRLLECLPGLVATPAPSLGTEHRFEIPECRGQTLRGCYNSGAPTGQFVRIKK